MYSPSDFGRPNLSKMLSADNEIDTSSNTSRNNDDISVCGTKRNLTTFLSNEINLLASTITIRIYCGGYNCYQVRPFIAAITEALSMTTNLYSINYLYINQCRNNCWGPKEIIDWLLESHVHFIIAHLHQGFFDYYDNEQFGLEAKRLYDHCGFPNRKSLKCPVFLQDKAVYYQALSDICLPTFILNLKDFTSNNSALMMNLGKFIDDNIDLNTEYSSMVLKFPYKTNGFDMHYCKSLIQLVRHLKAAKFNIDGKIPYAIIQKRALNSKEYKCVCFNDKVCHHFIKQGTNLMKSPGKIPTINELYKFAEDAIVQLKTRVPAFIHDCLVRVDIMINNKGEMVVNEFEGFVDIGKKFKSQIVYANIG